MASKLTQRGAKSHKAFRSPTEKFSGAVVGIIALLTAIIVALFVASTVSSFFAGSASSFAIGPDTDTIALQGVLGNGPVIIIISDTTCSVKQHYAVALNIIDAVMADPTAPPNQGDGGALFPQPLHGVRGVSSGHQGHDITISAPSTHHSSDTNNDDGARTEHYDDYTKDGNVTDDHSTIGFGDYSSDYIKDHIAKDDAVIVAGVASMFSAMSAPLKIGSRESTPGLAAHIMKATCNTSTAYNGVAAYIMQATCNTSTTDPARLHTYAGGAPTAKQADYDFISRHVENDNARADTIGGRNLFDSDLSSPTSSDIEKDPERTDDFGDRLLDTDVSSGRGSDIEKDHAHADVVGKQPFTDDSNTDIENDRADFSGGGHFNKETGTAIAERPLIVKT